MAARFSENGERYDIEVKAAESALTRPESLGAVYLRGSKGDLVRLDSVARVRPMLGASQIQRQSLQYAVQLKGSPTLPLAEAVSRLQKLCHDLLALQSGATPRFFAAADLPAQPLSAAALGRWWQQLGRSARTAEHPLNPGLAAEFLVSSARQALNSRR